MRTGLKNVTNCSVYESGSVSAEISFVVVAARLGGKWILIKRQNRDGWSLPCALVPEGAAPIAFAKRELYNRTGVISGALYPVCVFSYFESEKFGSKKPIYGQLFFAEAERRSSLPAKACCQVILRNSADDCLNLPQYNKYLMSLFIKKAAAFAENGDRNGFDTDSAYLFDKVCGAVVYCGSGENRKYVLIQNLSGHVGFPKGHVEAGETEYFTALRETAEETGLHPVIDEGLRKTFSYMAWEKPGRVHKTAVYFPAEATEEEVSRIVPQKEEILRHWVVSFPEAQKLLDKESDRKVLEATESYLNNDKNAEKTPLYFGEHIFDDIRTFLKKNAASVTGRSENDLPDPMILIKIHPDQSILYTNYPIILKISPEKLLENSRKAPCIFKISDDFINLSFTDTRYTDRVRKILKYVSSPFAPKIPLPDDSENEYLAAVIDEIIKSHPDNTSRGTSSDLINAGLLSMYGLFRPTSREAVMPIIINTVKKLLAVRSYSDFTESERLTLKLIEFFIKCEK